MTAVIAERRCPFTHFHTGKREDGTIHNTCMSYPAQTIKALLRNYEAASNKKALAFWPLCHRFHCFPQLVRNNTERQHTLQLVTK